MAVTDSENILIILILNAGYTASSEVRITLVAFSRNGAIIIMRDVGDHKIVLDTLREGIEVDNIPGKEVESKDERSMSWRHCNASFKVSTIFIAY